MGDVRGAIRVIVKLRQSCPYFPGSIWHNKAEEHAIAITIDSKHWALGEWVTAARAEQKP